MDRGRVQYVIVRTRLKSWWGSTAGVRVRETSSPAPQVCDSPASLGRGAPTPTQASVEPRYVADAGPAAGTFLNLCPEAVPFVGTSGTAFLRCSCDWIGARRCVADVSSTRFICWPVPPQTRARSHDGARRRAPVVK